METLLNALRAVAEPTRLRLLGLCAESELTVGDLTQILGQSQPRVSRHLRLLCEAGLLERFREGTRVFYRACEDTGETGPARLGAALFRFIPKDDSQVALDLERLAAIKETRAAAAAAYFRSNAARWDEIRSLHVDEREVEEALLQALPAECVQDLLDIGTGTGRILELYGDRIERGVGIDLSREMLAMARVNLERAGLRHCTVRHGDMYQLPNSAASFDAVIIHQVLHYAEEPVSVIVEAARVLRPGGRLVIVDFAPHALERLRAEHAHRRLGFGNGEIAEWCRGAGLHPRPADTLPGDPLTVIIWQALKPRLDAGLHDAQGAPPVLSGVLP